MSRSQARMVMRSAPGWRHARPGLLSALAAVGITIAVVSGVGSVRMHSADRPVPGAEPAWQEHLRAIDVALARRDVGTAAREWRLAYGAALGTRRWEPMAAVGDAALAIDALGGPSAEHPVAFRAEARQAYLNALWTARSVKSREGVERIAAAFAALGDAEMATRVGDIVQER